MRKFLQLKRECEEAPPGKKRTILNKMRKVAEKFSDWKYLALEAITAGETTNAKRSLKQMAELATTFEQCHSVYFLSSLAGDIKSGMAAAGKINTMCEAGLLTKRQKEIYYNICATLDSLSSKQPNA